ncbi:phosphatidylglycerophosphatase A family protein [Methylomonas rosea]|uniref:Phosphatidylglycerophosphatase A n=1 Tax=Methylomonas rosea TaxID=2952227 RepID=A0ABT1TTG5_9GAMM|nr:phosphatidylglycerophosphatase A [Methylomonas sp. WSC-7]MCQ8117810.1 phosphatidylglycerophosphatase A [Methylomonas sp. WSC-7]
MSIFLREYYGNNRLTALQIIKDPTLFLAFGFGSGLSKAMPGTMGTIVAIPLYLALLQTSDWVYAISTLVIIVAGIFICDLAAKKLDVHDFGGIVWDEIAGFLITMVGIAYSWQSLLAGFVLFRLFDIVKPWPIKWLDKHVHGGFGIMLDDVVAGIFAALIMRFWFDFPV